MDLELRHLQALVAVADAGTFGKAADALGYTQSAVSQQIAALEKAVGASLFDRPGGPRPVRLTRVGEVLLEHARDVLAALRSAEVEVAAAVSGERGRLRVGTIQSVGTRVIPGVLTRFARERPGVEILLHEAHDPVELLAMVEAHDLDITFTSGTEDVEAEGPYVVRPVLEDPFALLAPATPEWLGRSGVTIEEIAAHPLIGNRNPTCSLHQLAPFRDLDPRFVFHSDDNSTVQGCVAAGLGLSLAPMLTIDLDDPTTTVVPVVPPIPPRIISVAWHVSRRPSAMLDAFLAATDDVCAGIAAEWSTEVPELA
ncbi:MAG: LysR family transcriptional regulator [Actinomycetota bacterium]